MGEHGPRVALVGCGYWGKNLVRNFYQLGSLHAVYDVDEARSQEMSNTYGVMVARDFDKLLQDSNVQAVAVAAPASQHFELAKKALLAGKDVFIEKPLALRLNEGQVLVDLARRHGRILMVGHLLQYHPAVVELRRLIRAGELGKVQYIYSSRLNLGKLRIEENILWSFAPHDVSAILSLLDEEPTVVAAHGGYYLNRSVADVTLTTLDFASGVKAHIFVSWLHPFKEQKLIIVADRKMAVFDDTETDRKLVVFPHRIDWVDRLPVARKAEGQVVSLTAEEPLRLECQHFLECVRERKKPRTDGEEGLRVLRVLEACEKSLQNQGHPTPVETLAPSYFAHPTAVIDEPCEIGEGTKIWHFSHIMANSKIGKRCNLGQNVVVSPECRIGDNVKIQNNVSVYTGVELEDDVFCGPSMVFTNVINPRSHIVRKHEYRRTLVKRGASLGANSTIICGITIGQYAFVAAGAVVTRDVPDYALIVGVPGKQVGWMCHCGERLPLTALVEPVVGALEVPDTRQNKPLQPCETATCRVCGATYQRNQSGLERLS
jgi:UDP-2-acetamido-3-amino-2,3-dideoxy-glucuronate N-acetyltransferase